jgi:hypothetical protein
MMILQWTSDLGPESRFFDSDEQGTAYAEWLRGKDFTVAERITCTEHDQTAVRHVNLGGVDYLLCGDCAATADRLAAESARRERQRRAASGRSYASALESYRRV